MVSITKIKILTTFTSYQNSLMKFIKTYLFIIIGAVVLFTANTDSLNTPYTYIVGVAIIMFGLFNLSKNLKSNSERHNKDQENEF